MEIIKWMVEHHGIEMEMELLHVSTVKLTGASVPVFRTDTEWCYKGKFVRFEDLPQDLAKAFWNWQIMAACPCAGTSYLHDFTDFLDRQGRGWSGDYSAVVRPYLPFSEIEEK